MTHDEIAPGFRTRAPDLGLALLSALLLILAFPKAAIRPLAWVGFVPALFAVTRQRRLRDAFVLGWIWGFAFYLGGIYWITFTLRTYGHLPLWVAVLALVLLSAFLALYHALFALFARRADVLFRGPVYPLLVAACWVLLEHARSFVLSGFPWMSLGYSQAGSFSLIQISDLTGFYGVSALLVLANATLFHLVRGTRTMPKRTVVLEGLLFIGILTATLSYGTLRLLALPGNSIGGPARVALLQGNIDQDKKWDIRFQKETLDIYGGLARQAAPLGTDLLVLPETAAPFFFQEGGVLAERLRDLAREAGAYTLFGAPAYRERTPGKFENFNRAYLLDPRGEVVGTYDKVHLVPFGEYSPVPFLAKIVPGQGDFRSGPGPVVFSTPTGSFGVLICYEAIFPDLTRRFAREGAEFLVNITNDAWFGRTSSPRQHLEMATFRAIENRVWLVRAANTGITAIVDPFGHVLEQTRLFEKTWLDGDIQPRMGATFYTRYGDVFAWMCWVAAGGGFLWGAWRKRAGPGTLGSISAGDPF